MPEENYREEKLRELFSSWDLDGNGTVEYGEMQQILQASTKVQDKEHLKWIKKFEAQINQGQKENRRGSLSHISLAGGGQINFSEVDGEPSLDPDAFVAFLTRLTAKDSDEEFEELLEFSAKAVEDAQNSTQGTKIKKEIWEIFKMLDRNHDGYVDMDELETLLNAEKKSDRKIVLKWRAQLVNKAKDRPHLPVRKASMVGTPSPEATVNGEEGKQEEELDATKLRFDLKDFQAFLAEYIENDSEDDRIPQIVSAVRKTVQEEQVGYILQYKLHDVINDIMDDLLRERPQDVLGGIEKSVARLKRTQQYPKPMKKGKE